MTKESSREFAVHMKVGTYLGRKVLRLRALPQVSQHYKNHLQGFFDIDRTIKTDDNINKKNFCEYIRAFRTHAFLWPLYSCRRNCCAPIADLRYAAALENFRIEGKKRNGRSSEAACDIIGGGKNS